jgi:hypothetical protein
MTGQPLLLRALPLGLCLLLAACGKNPGNQAADAGASAPSASASAASAAALASVAPSAAPTPPKRLPTCRALRVEGEATVGAAPLASGAEVDGSEWVTLAKGASVTLKHAASGREIALAGPALFRACRRGREQVLLAQGKVTVGSGMGARPGAEVLIATPVAGVRYGDAEFSLVLDEKRLTVEVRSGQVDVDPALPPAAGAKPPKSPLHAKDKLSVPLGKPDVPDLMARCRAAAEAAESSARRVGDKTAPEPLGERAQVHVRARRTARAACTIAAAATGLVADPSTAAGLWAEAARWEGLWETIPRPSGAQAPEK